MIDSVIGHAGKTVKRWGDIQTVLDRFIYLGAAFVKDPETQKVLPLYHTIAYGFGFTERAYLFGISKKPGGAVRDLLAHPPLPALPSVAQLTEHWSSYKEERPHDFSTGVSQSAFGLIECMPDLISHIVVQHP
jgi:hypothetical protein